MRRSRGFTLVEIVLMIVVAAIALPPIMILFADGVRRGSDSRLMTASSRLAQDLMEEIRTRKWDENGPGRGGRTAVPSAVLGPETSETRVTYDDVDDYAGITSQSPPRDALDAVLNDFSGFTVSVAVEYVDDGFASVPGPTDHKRVSVTVSCRAGSATMTTVFSNF